MAASARVRGVALSFLLDGRETACDVSECTLSSTYDKSAHGMCVDESQARAWTLNFTAVQSTSPASLWRYVWDHVGEWVDFTYAPHGNAQPTDDEPHFRGVVKIGAPPDLGGAAGKKAYTFEGSWPMRERPQMVTA